MSPKPALSRRETVGMALHAAFEIVDDSEAPRGGGSLGSAIKRLNRQTDLLIEELSGELPFHDTLRAVVRRMG